MNRRQAAQVEAWAAEDRLAKGEEAVCLLCGERTPVFSDPDGGPDDLAVFDLCGRCNSAFRGLAQALADAAEARERRGDGVDQVAGQLELTEDTHS